MPPWSPSTCVLSFSFSSLYKILKQKKSSSSSSFFSTKIFYYSKSRPGHEELSFPRCQCFTKFRPIKRIPLKRFFSHHLHHHVDSFENLFFFFSFPQLLFVTGPPERERANNLYLYTPVSDPFSSFSWFDYKVFRHGWDKSKQQPTAGRLHVVNIKKEKEEEDKTKQKKNTL